MEKPGINGETFYLTLKKDYFDNAWKDLLLYGECKMHIPNLTEEEKQAVKQYIEQQLNDHP